VGKGKLKKYAELSTFANVIEAPLIDQNQPDDKRKGKWSRDFFRNNNTLVLELGCGKGEYSLGLARKFTDKNFIGVDSKGARLWNGAGKALAEKVFNVCFIRSNIEIIEKFFAPKEIEQIWLTFPDPQMKKTNKRLTSVYFLQKYKNILKKDGIIHLKTDSLFQYRYTMEVLKKNNLEIIAQTEDLYKSECIDDVKSIQTFYEKQWRRRGISIKYVAFRLNNIVPLEEPEVEIEKDPYRSFGRSARE